ncbi:MAG: hypothetical protein LQ352_001318 [Teloschistes flavicans]|nr:MAG: hypothetical protein LQ352_001318 [Teloschistes flavicans]
MGPRLSPFISLFDNQLEAINRAQFLRNQGYQQVFVAEIHARLQPDTVTIEVGDQTNTIVDLPIWHTQQRDIFIPMSSLTTALHVELDINTESEWLALDYIPRNLIKEIYVPDALGEFRLRSMMMMGVVPIAATIPRPMQQPLPQILPRGVGERGAEMRRGSRLQWMESAAHRGRGPPSRLM